MEIKDGLIKGVSFIESPHCDDRPLNEVVNLVVIHNISLPPNEFGQQHIEDFFCGRLNISYHPYFETIANLRVSAHVLIKRSGEIIQFVPFYKRAWHAGESFFADKERCNDFSIGIELEGADTIPYTTEQYEQLVKLIRVLQGIYTGISVDRIVGHADISPGRKTDPGIAFDWQLLKGNLI